MAFFMLFGHSEPDSGRQACRKKLKKIVSGSTFPKKRFLAGMGVGGGELPMVVVPLQGGQITVDLAIWSRSTESDPWETTYWTSKIRTPLPVWAKNAHMTRLSSKLFFKKKFRSIRGVPSSE